MLEFRLQAVQAGVREVRETAILMNKLAPTDWLKPGFASLLRSQRAAFESIQ